MSDVAIDDMLFRFKHPNTIAANQTFSASPACPKVSSLDDAGFVNCDTVHETCGQVVEKIGCPRGSSPNLHNADSPCERQVCNIAHFDAPDFGTCCFEDNANQGISSQIDVFFRSSWGLTILYTSLFLALIGLCGLYIKRFITRGNNNDINNNEENFAGVVRFDDNQEQHDEEQQEPEFP